LQGFYDASSIALKGMKQAGIMSLAELIPIIRALSSGEKAQLLDMLKAELAGEENIAPLESHKTYPLWTPYGAFGAARVLMNALQEAQQQDHE